MSSGGEALTSHHRSQTKRHNLTTRTQQDTRAHPSQRSSDPFLSKRQSLRIVLLLLIAEERALTRGRGVGAGVLLIELVREDEDVVDSKGGGSRQWQCVESREKLELTRWQGREKG